MNKYQNMADTAETLRAYHAKALTFLQENLNPVLSQHFKKMQANSALLVIDASAPQYIRNVQAILNLTIIADRAIALYSSDNEGIAEKAFNLSEFHSLATESIKTLQHFELKANAETQHLVSLLRQQDPSLFDTFTKKIPKITRLTKELSTEGALAIDTLSDVLSDITAHFNQAQNENKTNKQLIEDMVTISAPELEQTFELKDKKQRYLLNSQADGDIITSIKKIGNSLDYLSDAFSFELNAENGRVLTGILEGLFKYKEVIGTVCSLSPLLLSVSADVRADVNKKAKKLISPLKEILLKAVAIENELGLRPGYILDQIMPLAKRYLEFCKNIELELSGEELALFFPQRQALRKKTYEDTKVEFEKTKALKVRIDQVEILINTTTPLSNFSYEDLDELKESLPLLQLPDDLKADFEDAIDAAIEGKHSLGIAFDYLKNIAGHRISLQNQVWDFVIKNFSDIDSHQNMLESQAAAVEYGRIHELMNEKTIVEFSKEECEFFKRKTDDYATMSGIKNAVIEDKLILINTRLDFLKKGPTLGEVENLPVTLNMPLTQDDLALLNNDINSKNIKMANVAKECRQLILKNVQSYFSESVFDNISFSNHAGIFEIYSDDPRHIQDMKNIMSALTAIENVFRAADGSYWSALFQMTQLKTIAAQFHLSYQQEMNILKILFNDNSSQLNQAYQELSSEASAGLHLKEKSAAIASQHADGSSRGFFNFYSKLLSYAETAYGYLNFEESSGSGQIDLLPYIAQMRYIKEMTEQFLKQYFASDFSEKFTRSKEGLYVKQESDTAIIKDAKTLLNSLHHLTKATADVNTYLHGYYWDLPAAVFSISTFIQTLNELDLNSTHTQLCDIQTRLLIAAKDAVNVKINPLLLKIMKQGDHAEQAIGLRQGVLTNRVQSWIDFYQAQHENINIGISQKDDNAFLESRDKERAEFQTKASIQLASLEANEAALAEHFSIIKEWHQLMNLSGPSLPELALLKSIRAQISLLGGEATQHDFSPLLDSLITHYRELIQCNPRELKILGLICKQINIRQIILKKKLDSTQKTLDQFNATIGYRIEVIQDHKQTLLENAKKSEDAALKAAEAATMANEAQQLIDAVKLNDPQQATKESQETAQEAKVLSVKAQALVSEAHKLADESHRGSAKRKAAKAQSDVREVQRNYVRKLTPPVVPVVKQRGFFANLLVSILRLIAEILDAVVLSFQLLFPFMKPSPSNSKQPKITTVIKFVAPHSGAYENSNNLNVQTAPSETQTIRAISSKDPSLSNSAAIKSGFFAHTKDQPIRSAHQNVEHQQHNLATEVSESYQTLAPR
jgi:hypothetical protein